jgi:hypothetical protein
MPENRTLEHGTLHPPFSSLFLEFSIIHVGRLPADGFQLCCRLKNGRALFLFSLFPFSSSFKRIFVVPSTFLFIVKPTTNHLLSKHEKFVPFFRVDWPIQHGLENMVY